MTIDSIPKFDSTRAQSQYPLGWLLFGNPEIPKSDTTYTPLVLRTDVQDDTKVDKPKEPIETIPKPAGPKKKKTKQAPKTEQPVVTDTPQQKTTSDETSGMPEPQPVPDMLIMNGDQSDEERKSLAREIMDARQQQLAADLLDNADEDKYKHVDRGKHGFSLLGFLRPSDEEIDAQENGMRWHHEMENGWMLSPQWQKTVFAGVDREKQANAEKRAESARAKEARQRRYQSGWDKMIAAWQKGHWDDQSREYKELREAMTQFRNDAIARGVDTSSWQIPGVTAGAIQNALNGQITKSSKDMWDMESAYSELIRYIDKADAGTLTADDIKNYNTVFDKQLENALRILSGSNAGLADAEKVRIQYAALPPEMKQELEADRQNVFNTVYQNMLSMSRNAKSADVSEKLTAAANELLYGSGSLIDAMANTVALLTNLVSNKDDLPIAHTADLAIKLFHEKLESTMQFAIIDPRTMLAYIRNAYDKAFATSNNLLARANRPVDMTKHITMDRDTTKLRDAVVANAPKLNMRLAAPQITSGSPDNTNGNMGGNVVPKTPKQKPTTPQNPDNPASGWI